MRRRWPPDVRRLPPRRPTGTCNGHQHQHQHRHHRRNWIYSTPLIGWGEGGNVTSAGWQVTLCELMSHVSSRGSEAFAKLYAYLLYFTFFHAHYKKNSGALRKSE